MVVVFSILELLDNFSNQNYDELADSIEISLTKILVKLHLAIECIKADINETLDLHFSKELAQWPIFMTNLRL